MFEGYEVDGELGRGGMGAVFRARVRETGLWVAIKALHDELAASEISRVRFEREVHAMCRIRSPRFVRVLDLALDRDRPYFVMELLRGQDLGARLARAPMSLVETASVGLEIALAVSELHARGILHRDLKPSNIFLVDDDFGFPVKILDLGIAKVVDEFSLDVTGSSTPVGTLSHMAPEQILEPDLVSFAADVWALGLLLFEMLTCAHPFQEAGIPIPTAIVQRPPVPISSLRDDVPESISTLIYRALAKEPSSRPTAEEMVADLEDALLALSRVEPNDGEQRHFSPNESFIREVLEPPSAEESTRVDAPSARTRVS